MYPRLKTMKIMAIATGARYLHCNVSKLIISHASNTCPNAHSSAIVDFSELARHFVHTTTRVRVPIKYRTSIERKNLRIAGSVFGTGRVETVKEIVEDVGSRIVSV